MGKYFKYAIGEILLVMVGILLALQINNWNEGRKTEIKEKNILKEILNDLAINEDDLTDDFKYEQNQIKITQTIQKQLLRKEPFDDSFALQLVSSSNTSQFYPTTLGRQSMQSEGVNIISNDSIKNQILYLYDFRFEQIKMDGREFDKLDNPASDIYPYLVRHINVDTLRTNDFENTDLDFSMTTYAAAIKDQDLLYNDKEFNLILQKSLYDRAQKILRIKVTIQKIKDLREAINKELEDD